MPPSTWRFAILAVLLVTTRAASALSSETRARAREACEKGMKEAPELASDVCGCYLRTVEQRYPHLESENYAAVRDDVLRIIPDCFTEAISRRDPSVSSRRGWPPVYRQRFAAACRDAYAKQLGSTDAAANFCECSTRETERRFPDSLSAEKYGRHLLVRAPTARDQKAAEEVASICLPQVPEQSDQANSVEYQIIRYMRKGMTRANAARQVLRGFSGYYDMLTQGGTGVETYAARAEVEHTKGLVAEAGRLYVEACTRCSSAVACERDRVDAMMSGSEDKQSPCGGRKAPGEQPPPPMTKEEREAVAKDAAPYVASMVRGQFRGLVRARQEGQVVAEETLREAEQGYLEWCARCTARDYCATDIKLIWAGKASEKLPWSRAGTR